MKKWIRWWGLIAFIAVTLLSAVFWFFLVDGMVRRLVERAGTAIAGAEVDVAHADLSFSPLGIALSGIQVTDPESPATNSFEIGRVAFSLDGPGLLRRKVIIEEMTADGIRFGTTRKSPGFVVAPKTKIQKEQKPSAISLPAFETPNVKKILDSESLASIQLIDDAKADIQKMEGGWQKRLSELPNKAALDSYRTRLKNLNVSSRSSLKQIAGAAGDAKKIKDDIDRDLARLKKSKTDLSADLSAARNLLARAEKAPFDDIRRIREKYGLSPSGLQNMSAALFGDKISSWLESGFVWYNRVAPLLSSGKKDSVKVAKPLRGKGVDVKFPDHMLLPDFLIRTINASLEQESGAFSGTIKNVTPEQDMIGVPLTFAFSGSGMKNARSLSLDGSLDHIRPAAFTDRVHLSAKGSRVSNMTLSANKDFPVTIQDGLMDIELNGTRTAKGLKATLVSSFRSVRIDTGNQESGGFILSSLKKSLGRVSSFSLSADITGKPDNYDVKASSDLDKVFKEAVGRVVQEQSAKFEKELKSAIQAKTDAKLKELKTRVAGLNVFDKNIDGSQKQLNALLQEAKEKAEGKIKLRF